MIESDIETTQSRKRFDLPRLNVGMTNRADLTSRVGELLCVTPGARSVRRFSRQSRLRRVVFPAMAQQTWEPSMIGIVMLEF